MKANTQTHPPAQDLKKYLYFKIYYIQQQSIQITFYYLWFTLYHRETEFVDFYVISEKCPSLSPLAGPYPKSGDEAGQTNPDAESQN